jgi:myo-inositol 2-dehydrogenase / D-chiro-inositol 1-dehydrogenase
MSSDVQATPDATLSPIGPEEVRVALVGSGRIGRVHANAYATVNRGRLVACADDLPDVGEAFAEEYGLEVEASLDAILARDDVDAVLIATPNWLHAQMTVAALEAGKHVFCQKPIALTLEDADRVLEASQATDRVLQFGFMLRFTPPLAEIKRLIESGAIGEPIASRTAIFGWEPNADWFYDKSTGGGVILDTLIHFADLASWLIGPVERVHAEGGAYVLDGSKGHGSPDNATVLMRHANGASTSAYVTWTAGHGNLTLEIYGTAGHVAIDLIEKQVSRLFLSRPFESEGQSLPSGWSFPDLVWAYSYGNEQQHFIDRILGRVDGNDAATADEARNALAVVLAAQKALDEQRIAEVHSR